jgi:hypothetical protein
MVRMIPGKMFSLKDGTELAFSAQYSTGSGILTANNPSTGENFTGQYTGIYTGGGVSTTKGGGLFSSSVTTTTAPTGAKIAGILKGDKGTIINITMEIQPGLNPTGFGEGVDNNGVHYQIQISNGPQK